MLHRKLSEALSGSGGEPRGGSTLRRRQQALAPTPRHGSRETGRIIDDFGPNSLFTGRIVEALVAEDAVRRNDRDDEDLIFDSPLLSYLAPGRYAEITNT